MGSNEIELHSLLSVAERSMISEIEAASSILQLVTRTTGMRFAGIAKFTETDWIVCSAYDPIHLGIEAGDTLDLEITICSELRRDPKALFIPKNSEDSRYSIRPILERYRIESYEVFLSSFLTGGFMVLYVR